LDKGFYIIRHRNIQLKTAVSLPVAVVITVLAAQAVTSARATARQAWSKNSLAYRPALRPNQHEFPASAAEGCTLWQINTARGIIIFVVMNRNLPPGAERRCVA
jgi:hypothetical protein